MAPGAEARLAPATDQFIPGTWRASARFGGPVRYDAAGIAQELANYPWSCLEQTTSRGFPMAVLPDGPMAGDDRAGRLQTAVASVLDRQRFDGGFALWTASGEAEPWLTPYAMDFLLRAKAAGAVVPDQAIADALKFLKEAADEESARTRGQSSPGVSAVCAGARRTGTAGRGAGAGRGSRSVADAAGEGAARRRVDAGARPAAGGGGVHRGAGRAGAEVVVQGLRHRFARSTGDRGAAEGKRRCCRTGWRR